MPEPEEDDLPYAVMPKPAFIKLMAKRKTKQKEMDGVRSQLGGMISDATERHNYHKGAGGWAARLDRLTPAKREEWLFQFDAYREYLGWDKEAADLFREPKPKVKASRKRSRPQLVASNEDAPGGEQQPAETPFDEQQVTA